MSDAPETPELCDGNRNEEKEIAELLIKREKLRTELEQERRTHDDLVRAIDYVRMDLRSTKLNTMHLKNINQNLAKTQANFSRLQQSYQQVMQQVKAPELLMVHQQLHMFRAKTVEDRRQVVREQIIEKQELLKKMREMPRYKAVQELKNKIKCSEIDLQVAKEECEAAEKEHEEAKKVRAQKKLDCIAKIVILGDKLRTKQLEIERAKQEKEERKIRLANAELEKQKKIEEMKAQAIAEKYVMPVLPPAQTGIEKFENLFKFIESRRHSTGTVPKEVAPMPSTSNPAPKSALRRSDPPLRQMPKQVRFQLPLDHTSPPFKRRKFEFQRTPAVERTSVAVLPNNSAETVESSSVENAPEPHPEPMEVAPNNDSLNGSLADLLREPNAQLNDNISADLNASLSFLDQMETDSGVMENAEATTDEPSEFIADVISNSDAADDFFGDMNSAQANDDFLF